MHIPASEFKNHVISIRGCKIGPAAYMLEPRNGSLTFDFSEYEAASCTITLKRHSGNGKTVVSCGDYAVEESVLSKASHKVKVDLRQNQCVKIFRPFTGSGFVTVQDVILNLGIEEEEKTTMDWRKILSKATEHRSIRLVRDKAIASDGALIRAKAITEIATDPPNMYKMKEGGALVEFAGTCEIIKLKLDGDERAKANYPHINPEAQILAPQQPPTSVTTPAVVFDTIRTGFNPGFANRDAKVIDMKCVRLGRAGKYSVPLSLLSEGVEYNISIEATPLSSSGNSKFTANIVPAVDVNPKVFFASKKSSTAIIVTAPRRGTDPYRLVVSRNPSSTGDVLINRIVLTTSMKAPIVLRNPVAGQMSYQPASFGIDSDDSAPGQGLEAKYMADILNNAVVSSESYSKPFDEVEVNLAPRTFSMNSWVAKFYGLFPNLKVSSYQIKGIRNWPLNPKSIQLTDVHNLRPAKRVLLEEFSEQLSLKQIERLNSVDVIATTSIPNAQYLRMALQNKEIVHIPKFWPWRKPGNRAVPGAYDLFFCRRTPAARALAKRYKDAAIPRKLVLVGYRGRELPGVETFGKQLPYETLLSLIMYASYVIDFPDNIHYYSGILDLAFSANKNIITTNHWMNISKPSVTVIDSIPGDNKAVPSFDQALKAIKAPPNNRQPNFDLETYNNNVLSSLRLLSEM